ncbi:peptidoglycan D,D-transpeptidase FtsI family protein [Aliirhizobium smilacinae]|uniref:Penicillin-binding protein 2 n=1 Tax=Aliirhizobium smilacinae TaxID=1395944 RepID=A0A5C4XQX1_9HYPH|nr:penicillin-binding protein 2 [Rhizobium smilacinae]TNM65986.1 penicillin-binding protein 2 [Rhizobium smilacinae]
MSVISFSLRKSGRMKTLAATARAPWARQKAPGSVKQAKSRVIVLTACFIAAYGAMVARLSYYGLTPPEVTASIPANTAIAARPDITDRNGELLATDVHTVSMFAEPYRIVDVDETVEKIGSLFHDLDRKALYAKLSDRRQKFIWVRRQLTPKQQSDVLKLGMPAIGFRPEVKRFYPDGRVAAHVLGYVDIDNRGVAGMEKYLDMQGLSDLKSVGLTTEAALQPIRLSIDIRVQNIVHDVVEHAITEYKSKAAGAAVIDIHTGEVLALASAPDFDPNDPQADGGEGWLNRMTNGTFEMGSTFKTFSMAMALDSGAAKLSDTFDASAPLHYGGFTIHDDNEVPRRWLTVPEVFRYSSNIGTAKMMDRVGMDNQKAYLTRFGLLTRMQTELPEVKTPSQPKVWKKINSITISFGHGVATTPLQTAVAGAALVNGGELIEPTFLPRTASAAEQTATRIVKPGTSDTIRALFKLNGEQGSGKSADVAGFHVGGKTGTANKVINGKYSHKLSFNAYLAAFPIDHPQYVILSFCDEPLSGEHTTSTFATNTAAPMVKQIVARAAPMLNVVPDFAPTMVADY